MRCAVAVVAFAASILAGHAAAGALQQKPEAIGVTIEGQVVSSDRPVRNAEVVITGAVEPVRATTNDEGRFSVRVRVVVPGTITVATGESSTGDRESFQVERSDAGRTFTVKLNIPVLQQEAPPPAPPPPPPPPVEVPREVPPAPVPPPTTGAPRPAPGPPSEATKDVVRVPVFYATDRNRVGFDPLTYDGARDPEGQLHLGRFEVSVPRDHRLGQVERPTWRTLWREDANLHFIITARTELPYEQFYGDVRAQVAKSPRREALVFIHGYNVTFEDAVYRTAQIAYDLEFPGAPILYSWPSEGKLASYPVDLNNNEWTTGHLQWFLQDVADKSGAQVIHVIAHSMGNRALMNAMAALVRERPDIRKRFAEVMLTAPDIDADVFLRLAAAVAQTAQRVTLYASANDTALLASRTYQGYRRAGDSSQGVVTSPVIDTIDVSALKTDFLGHSYVSDHRSVVSDISELLHNGSPPERRFGLRPVGEPPKRYWLFKP